ncbi:hypothetical protein UFOVP326_6 [uncultured Caudovirales phage]|uniref:Uncharacterized protein n=1 Tax=uncultured Caudovirales phage TaxID=2100421 RepID=A0A6J5LVL2_9CAUD|nr:hypothetical protein UFOVP326_6 [uncultured Caudovirales phage]
MPAPTSQRDRPIAFVLDGQGGMQTAALAIRPEDLSRTDASRIQVIQTLGGAFADAWGPGVPSITISGHTGWRSYGEAADGEARFKALRAVAYDGWHERRATAIRAGSDPDEVRLTFADALDDFAVEVAPLSFNLRRSRSRPLLMSYQISMAVLSDQPGARGQRGGLGGTWLDGQLRALGLDSLADSINTIQGYLDGGLDWIDRNIQAPLRSFMGWTNNLYRTVLGAARYVDRYSASLMGVASLATQSGVNIFRSIGAIVGLPTYARQRAMEVAAAYTNVFCVLRRALRSILPYDDYYTLYGASNCSSTSGGRAISPYAASGVNTWAAVYPPGASLPVTVTPRAQAAMAQVAAVDPVVQPMSLGSIAQTVRDMAAGVSMR